jgi:dihydrolipoamide dehydrogenase
MNTTLDADILVLGGGPGGYTAAFRAADLLAGTGKKVLIVDRGETLGGVCLNVGCIPSKSLLHLAGTIVEAREAANLGLTFSVPEIDLEKVRRHRDSVVGTLTKGLGFLAKRRSVGILRGEGRFTSPDSLDVVTAEGKTSVRFGQCIIAAGSRPAKIPGFPHDDPRVWDSTDALRLDSIPKRLFILGGGIIGLEMATVYHAFGSGITIVEMMDQLVPPADADLAEVLQKACLRSGWRVNLGAKLSSMRALPEGIEISWEGKAGSAGGREIFDAVLVAVGRRSNADLIGLELAGLAADAAGRIPVDECMRTKAPGIFAIGDIAPGPQLAHKATHEGRVAAEVACGLKSAFMALSIPSVAYTSPELAWTGLTEREAKAKGVDYTLGAFPWKASGRSLSMGNSAGFTKALFDAGSKRIIGAAMVGPHAGELIAEAGLAIEMGADMEDIGRTIHPHPTLSETLGLAAEAAEGTITDL